MKKIVLFFFTVITISCSREAKNHIEKKTTPVAKVNHTADDVNHSSTDTVFFYNDEKTLHDEFVLAHLLQKKYSKDSICDAYFKLDFIKNKKCVYSQNIHIDGFDDESDWGGNIEFDSVSSPLKTIIVGFAACGYTQHNYLFYINDKNSGLVHQWESMSDSGWGNWGEIVSGNPTDFYFRSQSFFPKDESEEDDMGIAEYSDSIHFELKNKKWQKTFQTKEGEIYRKKEISLNEFHQVKE